MKYLGILRYQLVNDVRRIFFELLMKIKRKKILYSYMITLCLGLVAFIITIMSVGLSIEIIFDVFNLVFFVVISLEGLNIQIVKHFKDINYFGRMLIYPINFRLICLLNIIKFIVIKATLTFALFLMLIFSAVVSSVSKKIIIKETITFIVCFIIANLLYVTISTYKILRSQKDIKTHMFIPFIKIFISGILGIVIAKLITNIKVINQMNMDFTKEIFAYISNILPISLMNKNGLNFFRWFLLYVFLIGIFMLFNIFLLEALKNKYILNFKISQENNLSIILTENIDILFRKDILRLLRKNNILKEYVLNNISQLVFINVFVITCIIQKDIFFTKINIVSAFCISTYILYVQNYLTTYNVTALESDGKFIINYILSGFNLESIIKRKLQIEMLINGIPIIVTLLLPIILYSVYFGEVLSGLILLLAISTFIVTLAYSNTYSMACFPKYNWTEEHEIQNSFMSAIMSAVFNYIPSFIVIMLILTNIIKDKLNFVNINGCEISICSVIVLLGSIVNIFIVKIIYKKIGRPYGEYQN